MLELIQDVPNRKPLDIKKLQESASPTIMYGAGSYAVDVTRLLTKHGVEIQKYCVDKDYVKAGQTLLDKPVTAIEDVYAGTSHVNIVIGFADYQRAKATLSDLGDHVDVYFIDAPNHVDFFDHAYIKQNLKSFEQTYEMLADDLSRDIFVAFINAKISGDPTPLYSFANFDQYFSDPVTLTDNETFVDCGAYDGDTVANLLRHTNQHYKKIFAFEPDETNYRKLTKNLQEQGVTNAAVFNLGTWSEKTVLNFSSEGNMAAIVPGGGDFTISVDSIDNIVGDDTVTYIKMDIEGAVLASLQGARGTIVRDVPKLAICAYHKPEDLITLPQYIASLSNAYDFFLRHHQYMSWEMVLYAIPRKNKDT